MTHQRTRYEVRQIVHNVYSASFCISVAFSIDCDIVYVHIHVWQCFLCT